MLIEAAAALLVKAVALSLPAAIRALRIARFHRKFDPHAWRFIIAAEEKASEH